jgi:SAM-dependent methyltransferase
MQGYGQGFARVYNMRWGGFARQVGPKIIDFYAATSIGKENKSVLDLCCGAGHLAVQLSEKGYKVTGLDLSEHMLEYAKENTRQFIETGQAKFVQGDASDFTFEDHFGLVVSVYDSLNHLENIQALNQCFQRVHAVCDGFFIFDLNTRRGLKRWNNIMVDDGGEDALVVTRGSYDGRGDKAWTRISGFVRTTDGTYERFEETVFNSVYDLEVVKNSLLEIGWKSVYFARIDDLKTPIPDPENEGRVFIVAKK